MAEKMGKSSNRITIVQREIQTIKQEPQKFRAALGNVIPGKMVILSNSVPESSVTSADERMLDDGAAIDNILKFLNIEDKMLAVVRIGNLDPKGVIP